MAGFRAHVFTGLLSGAIASTAYVLKVACRPDWSACLHDPGALTIGTMTVGGAALGAMLPDIDSSRGRPLQIVFAVIAAIAGTVSCLLLNQRAGARLAHVAWSFGLALAVFGVGISLFGRLMTHRGIFHSLPMAAAVALWGRLFLISMPLDLPAGELWFIAVFGLGLGYLSHLALDAACALGQSPLQPVKLYSKCGWATAAAYLFLLIGALLNLPSVRRELVRLF